MSSSNRNNHNKGRSGGRGNAKSTAPNAWSRPLNTRPPPGLDAPPPSASQSSKKSNGFSTSNLQSIELRNRFLHLSLSLVGQNVVLTETDGTVLEGVLHTFTPFPSQPVESRNMYVLKAVKIVKEKGGKTKNGSTVIIPAEKVVSVHVKSMRLETNGKEAADGFKTDTEISGSNTDRSRDLVAAGSAWTAGGGRSRADALMGDDIRGKSSQMGGLRGKIGEWDQFKANEQLFNVSASFDENLYTTELDKSAIDSAKRREAERIAREIESTTTGNIHQAEERNQVVQGDYDEEDRYSGVLNTKLQARSKEPPRMNYAAAAAKSDKAPATAPPGFAGKATAVEETPETDTGTTAEVTIPKSPEKPEHKDKSATPAEPEKKDDSLESQKEGPITEGPKVAEDHKDDKQEKKEASKDEATDSTEKEEKKEEMKKKMPSKLNANAKEFTLNPKAKTFTPGGGSVSTNPSTSPEVAVDPGPAMTPIQQPPYMHQVAQPGMMPMINTPYGVRYPYGMEHVPQMPPHHAPPPVQQMQAAAQPHDAASQTNASDDQQQQAEGQPQGQQPQHPAMPIQYPPGVQAYYGPVPMARPHAAPPMYQHVMGHQQVPVVQAYRQMPFVQPPHNMRAPNGAPFYQSAVPNYPPYMGGEDDYRGGRGGRGNGRGNRRNSRNKGRGGGRGYYGNGGGRQTPQNAPDDGGLEDFVQDDSKEANANGTSN